MKLKQKKILEITREIFPREPLSEQLLVVLYELGDLAKCIKNMKRYPGDKNLYLAEARKAIGDLITQVRLTCELLGFSFEELDEFGYRAFLEKFNDYRRERFK